MARFLVVLFIFFGVADTAEPLVPAGVGVVEDDELEAPAGRRPRLPRPGAVHRRPRPELLRNAPARVATVTRDPAVPRHATSWRARRHPRPAPEPASSPDDHTLISPRA